MLAKVTPTDQQTCQAMTNLPRAPVPLNLLLRQLEVWSQVFKLDINAHVDGGEGGVPCALSSFSIAGSLSMS